MITRPLLACVLAVAAVWAVDEPAPAVVTKLAVGGGEGNSFAKAFVVSESLDGIEFAVDDPRSPNKLSIKRGAYSVEYKQEVDTNYLIGTTRQGEGKLDKAYEAFSKAMKDSSYRWVREDSAMRAAETAVALKQPDNAIAAIELLEKEAPRSLYLTVATLMKGNILVAKGDSAGASKVFAALKAKEKDWGFSAVVAGTRGEASLARAGKDYEAAAKALTPIFAKLDPATNSADFGQVGVELAGDLAAGGKTDEAIAAWTRTAFGAEDPTLQARAQLGWAQLLAAGAGTKALIAAFDRAAVAALVKGADGAVTGQARTLAIQLQGKLDKAADVPAQDKLEYRTYITKL